LGAAASAPGCGSPASRPARGGYGEHMKYRDAQ
jgi:hypothetical protein